MNLNFNKLSLLFIFTLFLNNSSISMQNNNQNISKNDSGFDFNGLPKDIQRLILEKYIGSDEENPLALNHLIIIYKKNKNHYSFDTKQADIDINHEYNLEKQDLFPAGGYFVRSDLKFIGKDPLKNNLVIKKYLGLYQFVKYYNIDYIKKILNISKEFSDLLFDVIQTKFLTYHYNTNKECYATPIHSSPKLSKIHIAILFNSKTWLKIYLKKEKEKLSKIDFEKLINFKDSFGMSPIHLAIYADIEIFKLLVDYGADLNNTDSFANNILTTLLLLKEKNFNYENNKVSFSSEIKLNELIKNLNSNKKISILLQNKEYKEKLKDNLDLKNFLDEYYDMKQIEEILAENNSESCNII